MIDYLLPAESGAVCEEFPLNLVPVPDVDVEYTSSVTHVHAFTHEGWQVPEGATSMTIRAVATTEHPGALPSFDEQVAQLEAAGWVRMQSCAPPLYDTTPMAYFEPRDGWDLTLISTPPSIASYNVSDYGVAANSCHR
ncbi:hypothetical protein ACFWFR_02905 [Oerskovia sp. NPDC060287]|uniref:hypothetical protein n=1 Tax=Oerskovia sp. NPDC060287 TaxID=3347095 RepID=UPI0036517224